MTQNRTIEIRVGTSEARFEMLDQMAPATAAAFWDSLPIEGEATHARWAGPAVWIKSPAEPLSTITTPELPMASIYPGTLVCRPTDRGVTEIFVAYGSAESRGPIGRSYATPVAEILGDQPGFFQALKDTWHKGSAPMTIKRMEDQ